ncbi:MAG: SDR family oxidoreductase [Aureliella sp.]
MSTQKALITGGSTGIGRATAIRLAKAGFDVAITYAHNRDEAETTQAKVNEAGRECHIAQLDLNQLERVDLVVDDLVGRLGGLDVLVNNAGMMVGQRLPDVTPQSMQEIFSVNVFGAVRITQAAMRHMLPEGMDGPARDNPGRVIVVTSVHEEIASPVDTLYTMTKHALGGFVKCLALDLTPLNVTVNAVAPGEIATPMNDMAPGDFDSTDRPAIPARRSGHPDEVAAVIEFLSGDNAGFVSGVRWPIDGGFEAATPLAASPYRDAYLEQFSS